MSPLLKTALFTLVVPGSAAVLVPLLVAGDRATAVGAAGVLGLLLLAIGAILYLRSAWDFASFGRGTPAITDAPERLVTRGFYRYTRNPMYVAVLSAVFGWAVLFGMPVLWAYGGAIFVFFSLFIRLYEEPRLTREFGDEYVAYMKRVGRWLPLAGRRDA